MTPLQLLFCASAELLGGTVGGLLGSSGAWDNAKKYIEADASEHSRTLGPDPHKEAVIGDMIGGPLKDTSGPSLNILIKLMAVESLVFAPFFATHGGLLFKIF